MHVERLPRRLWYRWSEGGTEIEYPTDIPTPAPEIKCDEVVTSVPPQLPAVFTVYAIQPAFAQQTYNPNSYVNQAQSYAYPTIRYAPYFSSGHCQIYIRFTRSNGSSYELGSSTSSVYVCGSASMTPNTQEARRRDLLVGSDRITNPTLNTPCPTWRFTGGNCPEGSKDCGNCCLDCASVKAGIEGITSSVLPFSIWRPKP